VVTVLNILPHRGGGAETFIDCLGPLAGFEQRRIALSASRRPLAAAPSIALRWPRVAHAARSAAIVQTHGDVAAVLSLPLLRRRPSVAVMQGLHFLRRAKGARLDATRRALQAVMAAASRTICSSDAEMAVLREIAEPGDRDRLLLVPNTIPDPVPLPPNERARVRAELELADDLVTAAFVGQMEERKDPMTVIAAAERVHADGRPFALLVAGAGPLLERARAHAGPAVRVLGGRNDVPRLLAAADVFVNPSAREGLSFAVLEAMQAGLAMVVSDGPGNPEAVGGAGLIVPVGDVCGFARAFARLTDDAEQRRRLAEAAAERFRGRFDQPSFRARMSELYTAVVPCRAGDAV
jgi:glycosyltransferase involved in cell wall biosynthesis